MWCKALELLGFVDNVFEKTRGLERVLFYISEAVVFDELKIAVFVT